jgi:hypothetical protein
LYTHFFGLARPPTLKALSKKLLLLFILFVLYLYRKEKDMIYLLVKDKTIKEEVEIKTMEDLWSYSHGYKKVVVDFENSTIYLNEKNS